MNPDTTDFSQPYFIGILTAVLAVILTEVAIWVRTRIQKRKHRNIRLKLIKTQLENNKNLLTELKTKLGTDQVYTSIDPSPFHNFLSSDVIDLESDENLLRFIYAHLNNISQLEHALHIVELRSAGFTEIHATTKKELEENLKNAIDQFVRDINSCITEINKIT